MHDSFASNTSTEQNQDKSEGRQELFESSKPGW